LLVENDKIFLNKNLAFVNAEFHTDVKKIVADVLEGAVFSKNPALLKADFSNVLFITSDTTDTNLVIPEEYFEILNQVKKFKFPATINTISNYMLVDDIHKNLFTNYDIVIMGFINNISESIFFKVKNRAFDKKLFVFGDPLCNSPEHNEYYMRYLTSAALEHRLTTDTYRISDKKRLNTTLSKLRKEKTDIQKDISSSINSIIEYNEFIKTSVIFDFLDTPDRSSLVVLPKRFLPSINSYLYTKPSISIQAGDILYNKYPYLVKGKRKLTVIPALSKVEIIKPGHTMVIDGHTCIVCDVVINYATEETPNNQVILNDVYIDFSNYIMNFDMNSFPSNSDDFRNIIGNIDINDELRTKLDCTVMQIIPFKIVSSEIPKYVQTDATLSYIETIEGKVSYTSDTLYYKHFCNTKDLIYIIYSEQFNLEFE